MLIPLQIESIHGNSVIATQIATYSEGVLDKISVIMQVIKFALERILAPVNT